MTCFRVRKASTDKFHMRLSMPHSFQLPDYLDRKRGTLVSSFAPLGKIPIDAKVGIRARHWYATRNMNMNLPVHNMISADAAI